MVEISEFCTDNKDLLTFIVAIFVGFISLGTFVKAIIEYKLQGRQKRAEFFDEFKKTLKTEPRIVKINSSLELEDNDQAIMEIPLIDKYYYLGYYEQIAIAVNSGLIDEDVAHYMFGYFALKCWNNNSFWDNLNRDSYYWSVFKKFVDKMQKLEDRNIDKSRFILLWDKLSGRNILKY